MLEEENEDRKRLGFVAGETKGSNHADAENGEVQTVNIWRGGKKPGHEHEHNHQHGHEHANGTDSSQDASSTDIAPDNLTKERLDEYLSKVPSEDVWRVKGFLKLSDGEDRTTSSYHILNWAFGRYELHPASERMSEQLKQQGVEVRLTVMGARGEARRRSRILARNIGADVS